MIVRACRTEELQALPQSGIEAQKIRALLSAYGTGYDFCRFFVQNGTTFLSALDGGFVLCSGADTDYEELSRFLCLNGFAEVFCDMISGEILHRRIGGEMFTVNEMRFCGEAAAADTEKNPPLDKVYEVLKTSFDIDYEPWYLDMSHRVRHGVTQCRLLRHSALVVQHCINGEALLSQVATHPDFRGAGTAKRLVSAVCAELSGNRISVLCEDRLKGFYRSVGFEFAEKKCIIKR